MDNIKKFEDFLDRMQGLLNEAKKQGHIIVRVEDLENAFPELKESEDEKIRKAILNYFTKCWGNCKDDVCGIHVEDAIAWLEKQEGCEHIKKDWLEHIKQSWYKEGFIDGKYSGGASKEWTTNDAATLKELIDFLENGTAKLQHDLTRYANWLKIQFTPIEKQGEQKPFDYKNINIRQNDFAPKSAMEAIKEGKVDNQNCVKPDKVEPKFKVGDKIYLKPEHRMPDDDTPIADTIHEIIAIDDKHYRFKGSFIFIEDQDKFELVEQKPTWSEEDGLYLKQAIYVCHQNGYDAVENWLKSLRPQNRWKPTELQMDVLLDEVNAWTKGCPKQKVLESLYSDLKKLREE